MSKEKLKEYLQSISKDRVVELCLQYQFDAKIAEQQLDQANERLGKLEDILEKYGVDVEKLNQMLEWLFALSGQDADDMKFIARDRKLIHQQYCDIKTDRDTWKRACELACEREDDCYVYDNIHRAYEFYQQAKKEGNDESNIHRNRERFD